MEPSRRKAKLLSEPGETSGGEAAELAKASVPSSSKARQAAASTAPSPAAQTTTAAAKPKPKKRAKPAPEYISEATLERARSVAELTRHPLLAAAVLKGTGCEVQALNNALMDAFRELKSVEAYSLLFELNVRPFSMIAARIMRMSGSRADPNDILQEAFLAIYRYPTRFRAEKPNAFRNWSYSIIRNTVYRHLSHSVRDGIPAAMLADVLEDENTATPAQVSEDAETSARCRRVYGLMLALYLHAYEHELKDRDRLALELVEVQGMGYRDATEVLGIRLENFKMVVCRARKKIFQSMVRVLGTQKS